MLENQNHATSGGWAGALMNLWLRILKHRWLDESDVRRALEREVRGSAAEHAKIRGLPYEEARATPGLLRSAAVALSRPASRELDDYHFGRATAEHHRYSESSQRSWRLENPTPRPDNAASWPIPRSRRRPGSCAQAGTW